MKYQWNVQKLNDYEEKIKICLKKSFRLNRDERAFLEESLDELTYMKNILYHKTPTSHVRQKYIDKTRLLPRITYQAFQTIPYYLVETIMTAITYFSNYQNTFQCHPIPTLDLEDSALVDMCHDFYKWLNQPTYLQAFEHIVDPRQHLVQFFPYEKSEILGMTYFMLYPRKESFLYVNRTKTIIDFLTLNHECSHAIMSKSDTVKHYSSQHKFIMELEGYWFDFLSIEYLKEHFDSNLIAQIEYQNFMAVYDQFVQFYLIQMAVDSYDIKKSISIVPIQKAILKQGLPFDINETDLMTSSLEDPKELAEYLISFLTCLELESTYQKSSEYAFKQFEQIRKSNSDSLFKTLHTNKIGCMQEHEDYTSLVKKIDYMNHLK